MKANASEFTGIMPLSDHPNLDESVNYQIDLLQPSPDSVLLHTLNIGDHIAVTAVKGVLHFEAKELIPEATAGQEALVLAGTTLEKLYEGDRIRVHGATVGGSMMRLGLISVGSQLELTKGVKTYLTDEYLESEKLSTSAMEFLRRDGFFKQDDQGEYRTRWLRILTGDVFDVSKV